MGDPRKNQQETFAAIDKEATNDTEKRDSRILYQALSKNRQEVGGEAALPENDPQLSNKILSEARSRSAELRRRISSRHVVSGTPIPIWLWLAWIVAIAAAAAAWWYFG